MNQWNAKGCVRATIMGVHKGMCRLQEKKKRWNSATRHGRKNNHQDEVQTKA